MATTKRTAAEVENLWPEGDFYTIDGFVRVPGVTTPTDAARVIEPLFFGERAVAGFYEVGSERQDDGTFHVRFERSTADDVDVVEERLRNGGEFYGTLLAQLRAEFNEAAEDTGVVLEHLSESVEFSNVSAH